MVGDRLWGHKEKERQIYSALTGISSNSDIMTKSMWRNFIKSLLNYDYVNFKSLSYTVGVWGQILNYPNFSDAWNIFELDSPGTQ